MNLILAEDIGGWLAAGTLLLAGVISSLLALLALIPASKGIRSAAILLGAPAVLTTLSVTAWIIIETIRHRGSPESSVSDMFISWLMLAGLPLLTGGIAFWVIWAKSGPRS